MTIILFLSLSFLFSFSIIPIIRKWAYTLNLVDVPSDRKLHRQPIPALGGVAIFANLGCCLCFLNHNGYQLPYDVFLLAGIAIFAIGLWDDITNASARTRLVIQLIIASLCFNYGFDIGGIVELSIGYSLPPVLHYLSTVLFIILCINAFNLIDGINGLAGGLSTVVAISFGILFYAIGLNSWALVSFSMAGSLIGFLYYNKNGSIFMGDNGSTLLGLMFSLFFLHFGKEQIVMGSGSQFVAIAMSVIALPILDLVRVSIQRLSKGRSPFSADKTHIHHLLIKRNISHIRAATKIVTLQLTGISLTFFFAPQFSLLSLMLINCLIFGGFVLLNELGYQLSQIKSMESDRRNLFRQH